MGEKVLQFPSTVKGFHYYRRFWQPSTEDEMFAKHEEDDPFEDIRTPASGKWETNKIFIGHGGYSLY